MPSSRIPGTAGGCRSGGSRGRGGRGHWTRWQGTYIQPIEMETASAGGVVTTVRIIPSADMQSVSHFNGICIGRQKRKGTGIIGSSVGVQGCVVQQLRPAENSTSNPTVLCNHIIRGIYKLYCFLHAEEPQMAITIITCSSN